MLIPISTQIYGFMRKVNLRNVDPAIDDPDASTWCTSLFACFGSFTDLDYSPPDAESQLAGRGRRKLQAPRTPSLAEA